MMKLFELQDIDGLQAAIGAHTGLVFDESKRPLLAEALEERMRAKRSGSAADYLRELSGSRREAMELAALLTVPETYFLRNADQFHVLASYLRSRCTGPRPRRVRVLSAGCSSGEEAYSAAIIVRETLADIERWEISILGVDINKNVLEKARAARYSPWALRETPVELRERYFRTQVRQHFLLEDAVRSMVDFEQRNLLETASSFWHPRSYDVVFCRNVLMYMTLDAARRVVAAIERALIPGGLLFLGHAENLRGLSQRFHLRQANGTFYYERAGDAEAGASPAGDEAAPAPVAGDGGAWQGWFHSIEQSSNRIANIAARAIGPVPEAPAPVARDRRDERQERIATAVELLSDERFSEALHLLSSRPSSSPPDAEALLLEAILLASAGNPAEAEGVCRRLLDLDELHAGAHYVTALCREHAGDLAAAIEHDRTAAYLDPGFAMPRFHLGLLLRRQGDPAAARRELTLAAGLLAREDPARIVLFSGGFGREGLIELCRREVNACAALI